MSDIGAMVSELIESGCLPETAARIVSEAFVAGVNSTGFRGIPPDSVTEKRRAYDRERKRNSTGIPPESTGVPISPLSIDKNKNSKRGTRLPENWSPSADDRAFALDLGWSNSQIDSESANFRDYWIARPGAGGCKLDWPATWRKWVRSSKVKPAAPALHIVSDKMPLDDAVIQFAKLGKWSRFAPVSDISQVPSDVLAKHGLLPDGRKMGTA